MNTPSSEFDIVCLSHLKWETTLFQRPQQLMRRMARDRRVLYVASIATRDAMRARLSGQMDRLAGEEGRLTWRNVAYPPMAKRSPRLLAWHWRRMARIAAKQSRRMGLRDPLLWLYFPGFIEADRIVDHRGLVYDCMDLFRGFRGSPQDIQQLESDLIRRADVVFTGGRSLQADKEGVNPRTCCFPSGVDFDHFARASDPDLPAPEDVCNLSRPVLGYFGAIDERIDFDLLDAICRKRPDWSVVMIGPFANMDGPPVRRSNLHWLGPRDYSDLPNYLKAFDVCLMPFAQTELTRHISPTKTPEYLAGGKPIVSTPVPDVVRDYGEIVHIADGADEFIAAAETALSDQSADRAARLRNTAAARSWESIADDMLEIIHESLARRS